MPITELSDPCLLRFTLDPFTELTMLEGQGLIAPLLHIGISRAKPADSFETEGVSYRAGLPVGPGLGDLCFTGLWLRERLPEE